MKKFFVLLSLVLFPWLGWGAKKGDADSDLLMKTARQNAKVAQRNTEATAGYHFTLAQAYAAEGNVDRAIEEYKLTLMFDPTSPLVYVRLATEYVKKGMFSAAMESCKEALQRDPKYTDARLILAGLYSTAREPTSALNEYDKVLKQDPKNEEAAVYRAQVLVEEGRLEAAASGLRLFTKQNPESAMGWYYLGRAEQQQEHLKEAVTAYRKAMDLRDNFTQAALALGFLYEENRMNSKAIAVYKSLAEDNQDIAAINRLATIYLKEEKYEQAIPYLESLGQADPDDLNVRVKLGLVQMELKKFDKAAAIFKKILEKNPDADRIHYYLGSVYEETKQTEDAIAELKAIKSDSRLYPDAALHISYLQKQAGRIAEAKATMAQATAKAPRNANFYLFHASLEEETKDLSSAARILEKGVKEFPDDEKLRYYLGSIYDRLGNTDKGLGHMEAILKINPENVDALNYIGYTWTQKGIRLNDAEKLLRRAMGLRPGNGYIQDSWGWYLFVRGRVKEAVVELEKAVKLKPNEPTILEHLADAYLRSNLREKALNRYTDAVKYSEDETSKSKIQTKVDTIQKEILAEKENAGQKSNRVPASVR